MITFVLVGNPQLALLSLSHFRSHASKANLVANKVSALLFTNLLLRILWKPQAARYAVTFPTLPPRTYVKASHCRAPSQTSLTPILLRKVSGTRARSTRSLRSV